MTTKSFDNSTVDSLYSLPLSSMPTTINNSLCDSNTESVLHGASQSRIQKVAIGATVMACSVFATGLTSASELTQTDIGQGYFTVQTVAAPKALESTYFSLHDLYVYRNEDEIKQFLSGNEDLVDELTQIRKMLSKIYPQNEIVLESFTDEEVVTKLYVIAMVGHENEDLLDEQEEEVFSSILFPRSKALAGRIVFTQG